MWDQQAAGVKVNSLPILVLTFSSHKVTIVPSVLSLEATTWISRCRGFNCVCKFNNGKDAVTAEVSVTRKLYTFRLQGFEMFWVWSGDLLDQLRVVLRCPTVSLDIRWAPPSSFQLWLYLIHKQGPPVDAGGGNTQWKNDWLGIFNNETFCRSLLTNSSSLDIDLITSERSEMIANHVTSGMMHCWLVTQHVSLNKCSLADMSIFRHHSIASTSWCNVHPLHMTGRSITPGKWVYV